MTPRRGSARQSAGQDSGAGGLPACAAAWGACELVFLWVGRGAACCHFWARTLKQPALQLQCRRPSAGAAAGFPRPTDAPAASLRHSCVTSRFRVLRLLFALGRGRATAAGVNVLLGCHPALGKRRPTLPARAIESTPASQQLTQESGPDVD